MLSSIAATPSSLRFLKKDSGVQCSKIAYDSAR